MSHASVSESNAPSKKHTSRISLLLRSGAMAMSRSAMTNSDFFNEIVDVGSGAVPNLFEQLLARLEQHGIRRCFADKDKEENNINEYAHCVDSAEDRSISKSPCSFSGHCGESDAREPYYYMCVPCEIQLTGVLTSAATLETLQDVHHHCSYAEHRHIASWMGEPDIDCTLQTSSQLDPTAYARIYVNGVPILISSRPGGGDMFFPLPHEAQERERMVPSDMEGQLMASTSNTELWNLPLRSIYTGSKQLLYSVDGFRRLSRNRWRTMARRRDRIVVQHIPESVYREDSFVDSPTVPALFEVIRQRLPKKSRNNDKEEGECGHRVCYVVVEKPLMIWTDSMNSEPSCVTVKHDGIYRVALLHADVAEKIIAEKLSTDYVESYSENNNCSQTLTVDAINQLSAGSATQQFYSRLNFFDLGPGNECAYPDDLSYVSS